MIANPNFIVPGAQKSSTTTLYDYLQEHPEIGMSKPKEPHYFSRIPGSVSWQWYQRCFKNSEHIRATGEASASYMPVKDSARRIYEALGIEVKLIFILRNPVERIYSSFLHMRKSRPFFDRRCFDEAVSWQSKTLEDMLYEEKSRIQRAARDGSIDLESFRDFGDEADWNYRYITNSAYRHQIERFLQFYPLENCLFVLMDDLRKDWEDVMKRAYRFIGVSEFSTASINEIHRHTTKMPKPGVLGKLFSFRLLRRLGQSVLPARYEAKVRNLLVKVATEGSPPMPTEARVRLTEAFSYENEALSKLIGVDLRLWNALKY
jgi:hypothetical protein